MGMFLGIDWGGTYLKAGIVDSRGRIVRKEIYSSKNLKKRTVFIKAISALVRRLENFAIQGVGIGAPGIIDIKRSFIYYLPNIPGWKNCPLGDVLKRKLKRPVFINNDANVFALAEFRCGAAKGKANGIFLTLGTGLGGAVILNHRLLEGATSAGELGHIPVSLNGELCGCGARGCIETYVGNSYLLKQYRRLKKNRTEVSEVKEIFKRALNGERAALKVWKEFSDNLGRFLAGMVNIFNPEVIVFGGGVSGAFNLFKPYVWSAIKKQAMWPQVRNLKLVKAKLKDAGIIGAALLAKENIKDKG